MSSAIFSNSPSSLICASPSRLMTSSTSSPSHIFSNTVFAAAADITPSASRLNNTASRAGGTGQSAAETRFLLSKAESSPQTQFAHVLAAFLSDGISASVDSKYSAMSREEVSMSAS